MLQLGSQKNWSSKAVSNPDETTVICITGNGLKTVEALNGQYADPVIIEPKLNSFEEIYSNSVINRITSLRRFKSMTIKVRIPTPLMKLTDNQSEVSAEGETISRYYQ